MILINPCIIYDSDIDTLSVVASNSFKLQHVYYSDGNCTELPCISWMYCLQQDSDLCERAKLRCRRMLDQDGPDSVGPWSILVFFSCWKLRDGWPPGMARDGQNVPDEDGRTEAFCTFTWAPQSGPGRFRKIMNHWIVGYPIFNDPQSSPYPETFRCVYPEFQVLDYLRHIYRKHCHAPSHSGWKPLCCRRTTSQATSHGWKPGQVLEYLGLWENSFHIYGSRNRIYIHSDPCVSGRCPCAEDLFPHLARYFAVFPHVSRAWTLRASNRIESMSRGLARLGYTKMGRIIGMWFGQFLLERHEKTHDKIDKHR